MRRQVIHDFYLSDYDSDDRTGYRVKRVGRKGTVITETWIPVEDLDWFWNKDYLIVGREEYEEVGSESWVTNILGER